VREVMIEGVSGILGVHPRGERPVWSPSRKRLEWANGAIAEVFSAEDPESLRGPQFHCAWSDEMAKWRQAEAAFDMLQFGLRLGQHPRQLITTTARPSALLKRLLADPFTAVSRAGTAANAFHLAPTFLRHVMARYAGTRLGRQELNGEIIDDRPDALWSRALLEQCRVDAAPGLQRIVVAVDPPATSTKRADACGIVAAGLAESGIVYVLADDSVSGATPVMWASKAIALWQRLEADALVVEVNQGGDMVRAVINEIDAGVPVTPVRATRGKWLRAEPVAALYEQGRVKHVGAFVALEDEMCDFASSGLSSGKSPDRLDALVWAVASLALGRRGDGPRIRVL
jgi:phage terminase large subunit-like protein